MIAHRNSVPPTKAEQARIDAMMLHPCVLSLYRLRKHKSIPYQGAGVECQHITRGRKRLGHLYTIPLHPWYHRGVVPYPLQSAAQARLRYGASLADGSKAFKESHGVDEFDLWKLQQEEMGLPAEMPASKILPRRHRSEAEISQP